jgi:hypothetical protein
MGPHERGKAGEGEEATANTRPQRWPRAHAGRWLTTVPLAAHCGAARGCRGALAAPAALRLAARPVRALSLGSAISGSLATFAAARTGVASAPQAWQRSPGRAGRGGASRACCPAPLAACGGSRCGSAGRPRAASCRASSAPLLAAVGRPKLWMPRNRGRSVLPTPAARPPRPAGACPSAAGPRAARPAVVGLPPLSATGACPSAAGPRAARPAIVGLPPRPATAARARAAPAAASARAAAAPPRPASSCGACAAASHAP